MIEVTNHGIVLTPTKLPFEAQAVLNPGCLLENGVLHMVYRAVASGNYSSLGYAEFKDNKLISRSSKPILSIEYATERHGLEDPRLVLCEGVYYLFYVVYDGTDAQVAYATATSLPNFTRQGIISSRLPYQEVAASCPLLGKDHAYDFFCKRYLLSGPTQTDILLWEKDSFIFPRKINGKFALIYRLSPEIQVIYFDDFKQLTPDFWYQNFKDLSNNTVLRPQYPFENLFIGSGCPPLETEAGWIFIYHAVSTINGMHSYQAGAALLDLNDPTKVLGRLPYPLFSPEHVWEQQGDAPNVVFPTGAVIEKDRLSIYYGAADSDIAYCSVSVSELTAELLKNPVL